MDQMLEELGYDEKVNENEKEKAIIFIKIKNKTLKGEGKIFFTDDCYSYKIKGKISEVFFSKSKFINFINKEKDFEKKYFIHDQNSLEYALEKANITEAIIINKEKEKKNFDSNDSKNSANSSKSANSLKIAEILNESTIAIQQEKSIKLSKIFSKENLEKRFIYEKICELDYNSKYYKEINLKIDIEDSNLNQNWYSEIQRFYSKIDSNSELFIIGPRGIGKTTTILSYSNDYQIPRLYFSISKLINFNNRKWKKISLYETIYIFKNEENMNNFQKKYINKIPDSEDLIKFILDYIKLISQFYEEQKLKKRILVILDDCNDSLIFYNNYFLDIIKYINSEREKLYLLILGECSYIYKKYYNYILENGSIKNVTYWNLPVNNNEEDNWLKLPLYFYRYTSIKNDDNKLNNEKDEISHYKNIIKEEIEKQFKGINLQNFFSLSKYLNFYSDIRDLAFDFEYFPLEFLNVEEKKESNKTLIKVSFYLDIYKEVFDEYIKGLLKIDNIKSTFNLNNNKGKDGIQFEEIIVEQLWNNTLGLENFPEKNKIKVNDIFSIKYYDGDGYKVENKKPIIIRQSQFTGKYYDLLLIINNNGKNYGIFIQIGINKTRFEIYNYYNNLIKYNDEYKTGIGNLINQKIEDLGFLLIFDYEKQISLRNNNNNSEGVGFCINSNIGYLIYKDFQLYQDLDSKNPITSIDIKKTLIYEEIKIQGIDLLRNNYQEFCQNIGDMQPYVNIEKAQQNIILTFINTQYNKNFDDLKFVMNLGDNIKGSIDFGFFCDDFEQINIIQGKKNNYISYKKEIFKFGKSNRIEKLKESEKKIFEKEESTWDLYLLNKKRGRKNE